MTWPFIALMLVAVVVLLFSDSFGATGHNRRQLADLSRLESKIDLVLDHRGLKYEPLVTLPPSIADAIARGEKIEAIKLHRAATGAGLKESKDFIEDMMAAGEKLTPRPAGLSRIESKVDLLLQHEGLQFEPLAMLPPGVSDALKRGDKIQAIKLYRAATGAGLRESKTFVEDAMRQAKLPG